MKTLARASRRNIGFVAVTAASAAAVALAPSASAASSDVESGTLTWGVKSSFISYLNGPIAHGSIKTADGASKAANGEISWSAATGTVDDDGSATLKFKGSANFYGHDGVLDFTISNPTLKVSPSGEGSLTVAYAQQSGAAKDVVVATTPAGSVKIKDGEAAINDLPATLSQSGVEVFSYQGHGFYPAGTAMAPISASVKLAAAEPEPTPSETTEPTTPAPSETTEAPAPSETTEPTTPAPSETTEAPAPSETTEPTTEAPAPSETTAPTSPEATNPAPSTDAPAPSETTGPKVETDRVVANNSDNTLLAAGGAFVLALGVGGSLVVRARRH